jgi:hypothetical protein
MILECPYCKKKYRLDPSPFTGWKSARVRCRMCSKGFTIVFPTTEPIEPPRQPQALTVTHGTAGTAFRSGTDIHVSPVSPPEPSPRSLVQPAVALGVLVAKKPDNPILPCPPGAAGAAGDTLSVPPAEAPPTYLLDARETPRRMSRHTRPPSLGWALLAVFLFIVALGLAAASLVGDQGLLDLLSAPTGR